MEHEFDFEIEGAQHAGEAALESLLECCHQLVELKNEAQDTALEELQSILEEYQESGYGVFSINGYDHIADPIEDDDYALDLLGKAITRRKEEGIQITPTHAIVSSAGHVLAIDADDFSQCTVVRSAG